MFIDKNNSIGEHFSIAEELMEGISEVEQKCWAVEKSVQGGYFTLEEALSNYKVSKLNYIAFLLRQKNGAMASHSVQEQFFETVKMVVSIYSPSSKTFTPDNLKSAKKIKEMAEKGISMAK